MSNIQKIQTEVLTMISENMIFFPVFGQYDRSRIEKRALAIDQVVKEAEGEELQSLLKYKSELSCWQNLYSMMDELGLDSAGMTPIEIVEMVMQMEYKEVASRANPFLQRYWKKREQAEELVGKVEEVAPSVGKFLKKFL